MADPFRNFSLKGRRAVVTASSRGIGRAIALSLAGAGAAVVVHGARSGADLDTVAAEIIALGGQASAFAADFGDPTAVEQFGARADAALGGVDILVSNAAIQMREPWDGMEPNHVDQQIQVNFKSMLALVTWFAPGMVSRGWGRILTVGSIQEAKPHPQMLVYAATKAAQTSVVGNLARQFAGHGVTVNNLAPGVIVTDRNTAVLADEGYAAAVRARIPANRFGEAQDCVGAALLLCSDAGAYITGSSLFVDGGMHL